MNEELIKAAEALAKVIDSLNSTLNQQNAIEIGHGKFNHIKLLNDELKVVLSKQ